MNRLEKIFKKSRDNKRKLTLFLGGLSIFGLGLYLSDSLLIILGILIGGFGAGQLLAHWD